MQIGEEKMIACAFIAKIKFLDERNNTLLEVRETFIFYCKNISEFSKFQKSFSSYNLDEIANNLDKGTFSFLRGRKGLLIRQLIEEIKKESKGRKILSRCEIISFYPAEVLKKLSLKAFLLQKK